MSKALHNIVRKIGSLQFGILQWRKDASKESWQVKVDTENEDIIHLMLDGKVDYANMQDQNVNLVQKDKDNYLYITGKVSGEDQEKAGTISISILKACWFIRRKKGNVSWLQEKYVYENYLQEELGMAS